MYHVYMNDDWQKINWGRQPQAKWIAVGEYKTQKQAESALAEALERRYPGKWSYKLGQYVHTDGGPGDLIVGEIDEVERFHLDYSTINLDELRKLPRYTLPPTYHVDKSMGMGCAGDPPGYPTHFLQAVWTQHGNSPRRGPEAVIKYQGVLYVVYSSKDWDTAKNWDAVRALRDRRLRRLWAPLPESHERTQIWIEHTYAHLGNCYTDPAGKFRMGKYSSDHMAIWPVDKFWYPVDPRKVKGHLYGEIAWADLNPEVQAAKLRLYRAELKALLRGAWEIAKDKNNHRAVIAIRRYYPEHAIREEYIAHRPEVFQTEWIDVYNRQPAPWECPGHLGTRHGEFDNCRMCGRTDIGPMERAKTAGGK